MKTITETRPSIFLTDYASYNNCCQFEFGHWVDLTQFADSNELDEYIRKHFKDCDKKRPLDNYGSKREEIMITDFEGFPKEYYSQSGCDFEKIFKYIELDFEKLSDDEKLDLWNEYCRENNYDNEIFLFDDEFFDTFFLNKPMEAARATSFGNVNWSDDYITFNGSGNLESISNPLNEIDETELIEWLVNK